MFAWQRKYILERGHQAHDSVKNNWLLRKVLSFHWPAVLEHQQPGDHQVPESLQQQRRFAALVQAQDCPRQDSDPGNSKIVADSWYRFCSLQDACAELQFPSGRIVLQAAAVSAHDHEPIHKAQDSQPVLFQEYVQFFEATLNFEQWLSVRQ